MIGFRQSIVVFFLSLGAIPLWAQFHVLPLQNDPNRRIDIPKFPNGRVPEDTNLVIEFPFFDDFSGSKTIPDPGRWRPNQGTFVNNTYCVNQLTKNVASFDGLNSVGVPYSTVNNAKGVNDMLTSHYIDLHGFGGSCSIPTLVFLWQCGGNGEPPDASEADSLVLQFKDDAGKWIFQWGALAVSKNDTFYMAKVPVNDISFYHDKFQFRFYTKGTQAGAYDVWNLDYVSLDKQLRQDLKGIHFTDNLNGWAVGSCGAILNSVDGGVTWNTNSFDSTLNFNAVAFSDANNGVAVGDGGRMAVRRSNGSGGYNWTEGATGISDNLNSVNLSPSNKSIGWAVGNHGRIIKTNDAGGSWTPQPSGTLQNLRSVTTKDDNIAVAVGDSGAIVYTGTGGSTWSFQDSISNPDVRTRLNYVSYVNGTSFFIAGENGVLLATTTLGQLWDRKTTNTSSTLNAINFVGLDTAWAMGHAGASTFSTNKGVRWTNIRPISKWNINSIYSNTINQMWLCGNNNLLAKYDKTKNAWLSNSSFIQTFFKDRAFATEPNSLLKKYRAMPVKQYLANKEAETADTLKTSIFNLDRSFTPTNYTGDITISSYNSPAVTFNFLSVANQFINQRTRFPVVGYPDKSSILLDPGENYKIKTTYSLSVGDPTIFQVNDTISSTIDCSNYYAYDDGSAEFAIITNQQFGRAAVRYVLNVPDTISSIDIYFTQIVKSLKSVSFNLFVWKKLDNALNAPSLFNNVGAAVSVRYGDSLNKFQRYKLTTLSGNDTTILVSDTIYIGYRQITNDNLAIGFDRNTNSATEMYYETTGKWEKYIDQYDFVPGSMMIRPVFGKRALITEIIDHALSGQPVFTIFPNPTSGEVRFYPVPEKVEIVDLSGKLILETRSFVDDKLSLTTLSDGVYIIRLIDGAGKSTVQRLIIQK